MTDPARLTDEQIFTETERADRNLARAQTAEARLAAAEEELGSPGDPDSWVSMKRRLAAAENVVEAARVAELGHLEGCRCRLCNALAAYDAQKSEAYSRREQWHDGQ